ncbi:MAG: hypothetical protein WAN43_06495 [Rhodomicrobium sp.]
MSRESAEFVFAVRLREDGAPFVALQPKGAGLEGIEGELGLDLYRGTSLEEAKQLARFLNSNIKAVSYAPAPHDPPPPGAGQP